MTAVRSVRIAQRSDSSTSSDSACSGQAAFGLCASASLQAAMGAVRAPPDGWSLPALCGNWCDLLFWAHPIQQIIQLREHARSPLKLDERILLQALHVFQRHLHFMPSVHGSVRRRRRVNQVHGKEKLRPIVVNSINPNLHAASVANMSMKTENST